MGPGVLILCNTVCVGERIESQWKFVVWIQTVGERVFAISHVARIESQRGLPHNCDRSMASHNGDICTIPNIHRQNRSYAVDTLKEEHRLSDMLAC